MIALNGLVLPATFGYGDLEDFGTRERFNASSPVLTAFGATSAINTTYTATSAIVAVYSGASEITTSITGTSGIADTVALESKIDLEV